MDLRGGSLRALDPSLAIFGGFRNQGCNFAGRRRTFRHLSLQRVQKYWCTQCFVHVAVSGVSGRRRLFGLSTFSCHGARGGPGGVGHGAGLASKLGCRRGCAAKSRGPGERRACAHQSIHAQTMITFVLPEHALTRASMPKP